jgi:hypothetical protein
MEAQYVSHQQMSMEMFLRGEEVNDSAENNGDPSTATMTMSGSNSNIFFWSSPSGNIYYGGTTMRTTNQVLTLQSLEGDVAKAERKRRLEVAIEDTSFIVKSGDIILHHDIDIDIDDNDDDDDDNDNQHNDIDNDTDTDNDNDIDIDIDIDNDVKNVGDDKGGSEYEEDDDIEQGINPSITLDIDNNDNNAELRLPSSFVITNNQQKQTEHTTIMRRNVPAVCAICLGNYEVGDRVTCSPIPTVVPVSIQDEEEEETQQTSSSSTTVTTTATITPSEESSSSPSLSLSLSCCPHAFHRDCIVQWCAKKNNAQPECPVCRRTFCTVIPLTSVDLTTLNINNNNNNNAGTTSLSSTTTTETPSTQNMISSSMNVSRQIPMIALPIINTSDRIVMILPNPDMAAFHGHHHYNHNHNHNRRHRQMQHQHQHQQSATTTTTTTTEDSNTSTTRDHRQQ